MGKRKSFRVDRSRTPLIATTLVLFGGVVACLVVATPFSTDMRYPLLVIAGGLITFALFSGLIRQPTVNLLAELQALAEARNKKTYTYKLKRIRPTEQTGPQKPPTAETIREIRGK